MRAAIVLPSFRAGDAIGNDVLGQLKCLKDAGIEVGVWAEGYDRNVSDIVEESALEVLDDPGGILIYHHSTSWPRGEEMLRKARGRRIVRYHNITPEHYFLPYSLDHFNACLQGRIQTRRLARMDFDMLWPASEYNARDFTREGYPADRSHAIAPFHKIEDFDRIDADTQTLTALMDGKINILFVGRVAPNKGHRHLIKAAFYYRMLFGPSVRLNIVGGLDKRMSGYSSELKGLATELGLSETVVFSDDVSFEQLKSYYLGAHVFLLLSEHEGFCVPIIEAQHMRIPIVAYVSSAIAETLGQGGLLYGEMDYAEIASAIHEAAMDGGGNGMIRDRLTRAGTANTGRFTNKTLSARMTELLGLLEGGG